MSVSYVDLSTLVLQIRKINITIYSHIFQNIVALVMIFIRWCIPDMSVKLRNRIRREAYITNEIIIHQEALRAYERSEMVDGIEPRIAKTYVVANESADRWNRVMGNCLTTSEFDLEVHGTPVSPINTAPRINSAVV